MNQGLGHSFQFVRGDRLGTVKTNYAGNTTHKIKEKLETGYSGQFAPVKRIDIAISTVVTTDNGFAIKTAKILGRVLAKSDGLLMVVFCLT